MMSMSSKKFLSDFLSGLFNKNSSVSQYFLEWYKLGFEITSSFCSVIGAFYPVQYVILFGFQEVILAGLTYTYYWSLYSL